MNKEIPVIRFKGFDDNWEKHKVSDFSADTFGGGTPKTTNGEFWGGTIPWIQSSDLQDHIVSNVATKKGITEIALKKSATKLVPENSIAIVTRVGVGKLALMSFKYTTSQDFLSLSNLKVNEWFGVYSLYNKLQKELYAVQGTSIKGITKADLLEKNIKVPLNLGEQQKIGTFFKQLDDTIALQQQLVGQQQQYKKAMLQRMFPQKGESVPKVRFNGFSGDWEEKKLSQVANYRNGKGHEKNISHNGKYIVINSKFVSTNGKVKKFSDEQIEPMHKNEIAFVLSDVPNGRAIAKTFLVQTNNMYSLNQRVAGITPGRNTDAYFMYTLMNRHHYFLRFDDGVGQTNLSKKDVERFIENYPSFEEQNKIGTFFKQLDDTIALLQKELEDYHQLKKALLQCMFV